MVDLSSSKKQKDIAIVIACLFGFFGAWFGVPAGIQALKSYDLYRSRSVVPVTISAEEKKKHEDAILEIKKAIANSDKQGNPNYAKQYQRLGEHYEALGYLGRAERAFVASRKEGTDETVSFLNLARVNQEMRYFKKSVNLYRQAIDRDPNRPDIYQKLAELYFYDLKDSLTARGVYIEGLSKTGNNLDLMKLFAQFLEFSGDRREAYIYWDAVLQKDRQNKSVEAYLKNFEDIKADFK